MSNFSKLFRSIQNSISEEKSIAGIGDRSAKDRNEPLGEGIACLKEMWKKAAGEMTEHTDSCTMQQLIRQHNEQNKLLKQHAGRFLACKRILIANESRQKLDSTIQHAYFGNGGIRFFIPILQEHAAMLDPERQTVSEMVAGCYNSAILPMMRRRQAMEKKCAALEQEIRNAETLLTDSASLYRALGYTPCKQRIIDLEQQEREGTYADQVQGRRHLKKILDDNREALQKMLAASDPMPEPVPLKNAALRADLAELLDEEKWDPVFAEEGQTPAGYASRIRAYLVQLEDSIWNRYLLPDEAGAQEKESYKEDVRDE